MNQIQSETPNNQMATPVQAPKKGGGGCLLYGCLTVIILIILAIVGAYFAIRGFVVSNTDDAPMSLPTVQVSPEVVGEAMTKFAAFKNGLEGAGAKAPLVLNEAEINGIISSMPNLSPLKDSLRVSVKGDQIGGKVSVDLGAFGFKDRYLNGEAIFHVSLAGDQLVVNLVELEMNGKKFGADVMSQLSQKNFASDYEKDEKMRTNLSKIKSISVKDGVVTITPK